LGIIGAPPGRVVYLVLSCFVLSSSSSNSIRDTHGYKKKKKILKRQRRWTRGGTRPFMNSSLSNCFSNACGLRNLGI
jgi:hypothetical protein